MSGVHHQPYFMLQTKPHYNSRVFGLAKIIVFHKKYMFTICYLSYIQRLFFLYTGLKVLCLFDPTVHPNLLQMQTSAVFDWKHISDTSRNVIHEKICFL